MTSAAPIETRRNGDALAHGRIDPALLSRQIALGFGKNKSAKHWPTWRGSFEALLHRLSVFAIGPKDAEAFLQGTVRDNASGRTAASMAANYLLMLDLDTGTPVAELVERVKASGLLAVVYTTHSHLTTVTEFSRDDLLRWMGTHDRGSGEPTAADAVAFLKDKKKVRPEILEAATLGNASDPDKRVVLHHQPMPRARILLLLDKTYEFNDDASRQNWKDKYGGVARMFGVVYDPSCSDPNRLMYTPRVAAEADKPRHEIHVIAGKVLDLTTIPVETATDRIKSAAGAKTSTTRAGAGEPYKFATEGMSRFMRIGAGSFRASDWLKDQDPKGVRCPYPNEPKHDHECPRENGHTVPDDKDRAFMVRNAVPDGNGFGMSCRHASCIAFAQRPDRKEDRARYLDLLCERHGITDATELLEWCDDEARAEWAAGRGFNPVQPERPLLFLPDHMATAREFLKRCRTFDGGPTIRRYQSEWHAWDSRRYVRRSGESIDGEVRRFLESCDHKDKKGNIVPVTPNNEHVANVLKSLAALPGVGLDDALDAPIWLTDPLGESRPPANEMLACTNGILHLKTRKLYPHTAAFFSPNCLPYAYDPNAPKPVVFLRCLDEWFGGDRSSIDCLRIWFGLHLAADTRHHKALYIKGPRRGGKGTLIEMLGAMLGEENIAAPLLDTFGEKFGLEDLIGKRAAVVADARLGDRAQPQKIVTRLLGIIANDRMRIDRKHIKAAANVRLNLLVTICSNDPLDLHDPSGAFASRFIVLLTRKSFLGCEDKTLKDKLRLELPGILNWALFGMIIDRFFFGLEQPASSADATQEMEDRSAPVAAFVRICCDVGPEKSSLRTAMHEAFTAFAAARSYPLLDQMTFGKALSSVVHVSRGGTDDARTYKGLALKSDKVASA